MVFGGRVVDEKLLSSLPEVYLTIVFGGEGKFGYRFRGRLPGSSRFITDTAWGYATPEEATRAGKIYWEKVVLSQGGSRACH